MTKNKRPIREIAADIESAWRVNPGDLRSAGIVNYAAKPYLQAMFSLNSIDDAYGMDSGRSVVAYFLSNARSFRGDDARRLKAELKALA